MKKFFIFIPLFFFFFIQPVHAFDLTISCNSSSCSPETAPPFFDNTTVWYPGLSQSKTVHVDNTDTNPLTITTINKKKTTTSLLDTAMSLVIRRDGDGTIVFNGTIEKLYATGWIDLATIDKNTSENFTYTVTMDPNVDNTFQNVSTAFDLSFHFSGGTPDTKSTSIGGTSTNESKTNTSPTSTPPLIRRIFSLAPPVPTSVPAVQGDFTPKPEEGQIEGLSICTTCVWWPFLLGEILALIILYKILLKKKSFRKRKLVALSVPLFTYMFFLWWNRSCMQGIYIQSTSLVCQHFLLVISMVYAGLSLFCCQKKHVS